MAIEHGLIGDSVVGEFDRKAGGAESLQIEKKS
jgi:hypothetical protein